MNGSAYLRALEVSDLERRNKLHNDSGFSVEGTLKNYIFNNNCWKDLIVMGICS